MAHPARFRFDSILEVGVSHQLAHFLCHIRLHPPELVLHGSGVVRKSQRQVANPRALLLVDLLVQIFALCRCRSIYILLYQCFHVAAVEMLLSGKEGEGHWDQFVELLRHCIVGCLPRLLLQVFQSFLLLLL